MKTKSMKPKVEIIKEYSFSKVGVDEIVGLKDVLTKLMKPVQEYLKGKCYWQDEIELGSLEYKSRDGFIPYSHNCGGVEIDLVLPKVEEYEFPFVEFGECDGCDAGCSACTADETKYPENGGECSAQAEGHLDARFRIIFKFEGISDEGKLQFHINACGGNGDAPYFRLQHLSDLYESSFEVSTLKQLERVGRQHVNRMLRSFRNGE